MVPEVFRMFLEILNDALVVAVVGRRFGGGQMVALQISKHETSRREHTMAFRSVGTRVISPGWSVALS